MATPAAFPWRLFEALSNARGVTGHEGPVRKLLLDFVKPHADSLSVDAMGSILVKKKGRRAGAHVLLAAHMDEVGFMVVKVEKSGLLRVRKVGGLDDRILAGKRLRVGAKAIPGVLGIKAPHISRAEDLKRTPRIEDLLLDIGAEDGKQAGKWVSSGESATFDTAFESWESGVVRGKAFDDRVGCALLAALVASPSPVDFTAVFTTQEEIGLRGARAAAFRLAPDVAVALEGTGAADTPRERADELGAYPVMGGGPVLTRRDGRSITDRSVFEVFVKAAGSAGIRWQHKRPGVGGTDAGAFHGARSGARSISVSVPCRYIHAPAALAARSDIEATLELARAAVPALAALKRD